MAPGPWGPPTPTAPAPSMGPALSRIRKKPRPQHSRKLTGHLWQPWGMDSSQGGKSLEDASSQPEKR